MVYKHLLAASQRSTVGNYSLVSAILLFERDDLAGRVYWLSLGGGFVLDTFVLHKLAVG
jgi:hypothetical protein